MGGETAFNTNAEVSNLALDQTNPLTSPRAKGALFKRALDIILSTLMMILSLPVPLPMALAIKLENRSPVFCRQGRCESGTPVPSAVATG